MKKIINLSCITKNGLMINYLKIACIFILVFLAIVLIISSYTFVLIIPSMAAFIKRTHWFSDYAELLMLYPILMGVFFSGLYAKWITIWFFKTPYRYNRIIILGGAIFLLCISLSYWFVSICLTLPPQYESNDGRFYSGPYPYKNDLLKLKALGYTNVVSLLDPLLLPAEPILIKKEELAAKETGVNLIQIPMVSGVPLNEADVHKIDLLIREQEKKYYVHANNDSERVKFFIDFINQF